MVISHLMISKVSFVHGKIEMKVLRLCLPFVYLRLFYLMFAGDRLKSHVIIFYLILIDDCFMIVSVLLIADWLNNLLFISGRRT